MTGAPTDVVLGMPSLPGLYGSALATAARRRVTPSSAVRPGLPAVRHRVDGVRVDLADLTRFQHLIDAAARDVLPSAYIHTVAFPVMMSVLARPDFPLPLLGMVHLSNEVRQTRPIGAFEELDVVARAEGLRAHASGTQVDVVTEVGVSGETVWTGRSVYLARGIRLEGEPTVSATSEGSGGERPSFVPPIPTGLWRLDAGTGRRYAAVSGDWNPIHLNAVAAKALGMRTLIAHGMYLAARMVEQAAPAPEGALDWRIDFATPVLLPGAVTTSFARTRDGDGTLVDVVAWSAKRQRRHFSGRVRAE